MTAQPLTSPDYADLAEWFEVVLRADMPGTAWTLTECSEYEAWFEYGQASPALVTHRRTYPATPQVRVVVSDRITVHEFGTAGVLEATTHYDGDMIRQAPRALHLLESLGIA